MSTGFMVPKPPFTAPDAAVVPYDVDTALTIADFGKNITNTGASAGIVLTLPPAADVAGMSTRINLLAAYYVRLTPASGEKIFLGGSGVADKYVQIAAVVGNYAEIYSDGVQYHVIAYSGVLTKQA